MSAGMLRWGNRGATAPWSALPPTRRICPRSWTAASIEEATAPSDAWPICPGNRRSCTSGHGGMFLVSHVASSWSPPLESDLMNARFLLPSLVVAFLLQAPIFAVAQVLPPERTAAQWDTVAEQAEARARRAKRAQQASKREAARHRRAARAAESEARRADTSMRRSMARNRARSAESAARRADHRANREARKARVARRDAGEARAASRRLRAAQTDSVDVSIHPPDSTSVNVRPHHVP